MTQVQNDALESTGLPERRRNSEAKLDNNDKRVQLAARMVRKGDAPADAWAAKMKELGPDARKMMDEGLQNGLKSLKNPPKELADFLTEMERVPEGTDLEIIKNPPEAFFGIEMMWVQIINLFGALFHTYSNPAMSRILHNTGRLVEDSGHRLRETMLYRLRLQLPDGSGPMPGHPGFVTSGQVRMLHAMVRAGTLKKGWDVDTWGTPINQLDMARTWLDSTFFAFRAAQKMGFEYSDKDLSEMYAHWRYCGHLLGVDEELIGHVKNHDDAEDLLDIVELAEDGPDDKCRELVDASMQLAIPGIADAFNLPSSLAHDVCHGMSRFIQGTGWANALGLKKPEIIHMMPLFVHDNQVTRKLQQSDPKIWKKHVDSVKAAFKELEEKFSQSGAEYETFLTNSGRSESGRSGRHKS